MNPSVAQMDREIRLAISTLSTLADLTVNEGAGLRMLLLPDDSHFGETRHPDDLPPVDEFEIGRCVENVEGYVYEQKWKDSLSAEVWQLGCIVNGIFSSDVVAGYEAEKADGKWDRVPGPHEEGADEVPLGYFHNGLIAELVEKARPRLRVDQDEPLSMHDIALLTGKRDATIATSVYRNAFKTYEHDGKRYAAVADVLPWLVENGYQPTRKDAGGGAPAPASNAVAEYVFVPVARDGSVFDSSCAVGGRYTIGAKGSETKHDDYFEALDKLQRMPTPRWRRPGPARIPGIVSGVRFERIPRNRIKPA